MVPWRTQQRTKSLLRHLQARVDKAATPEHAHMELGKFVELLALSFGHAVGAGRKIHVKAWHQHLDVAHNASFNPLLAVYAQRNIASHLNADSASLNAASVRAAYDTVAHALPLAVDLVYSQYKTDLAECAVHHAHDKRWFPTMGQRIKRLGVRAAIPALIGLGLYTQYDPAVTTQGATAGTRAAVEPQRVQPAGDPHREPQPMENRVERPTTAPAQPAAPDPTASPVARPPASTAQHPAAQRPAAQQAASAQPGSAARLDPELAAIAQAAEPPDETERGEEAMPVDVGRPHNDVFGDLDRFSGGGARDRGARGGAAQRTHAWVKRVLADAENIVASVPTDRATRRLSIASARAAVLQRCCSTKPLPDCQKSPLKLCPALANAAIASIQQCAALPGTDPGALAKAHLELAYSLERPVRLAAMRGDAKGRLMGDPLALPRVWLPASTEATAQAWATSRRRGNLRSALYWPQRLPVALLQWRAATEGAFTAIQMNVRGRRKEVWAELYTVMTTWLVARYVAPKQTQAYIRWAKERQPVGNAPSLDSDLDLLTALVRTAPTPEDRHNAQTLQRGLNCAMNARGCPR